MEIVGLSICGLLLLAILIYNSAVRIVRVLGTRHKLKWLALTLARFVAISMVGAAEHFAGNRKIKIGRKICLRSR